MKNRYAVWAQRKLLKEYQLYRGDDIESHGGSEHGFEQVIFLEPDSNRDRAHEGALTAGMKIGEPNSRTAGIG